MLYKNIMETIGGTPIVELNNIKKELNLPGNIYAKIESFNPGGSVKDRVGLNMLKKAFENNLIDNNTTVIEPTSGNTGIGLSLVCASMGLKLIICMPDSMSVERQQLIKAYGSELILTPGKLGMKGAIDKAEQLAKEYENSFVAGQFSNSANPECHFITAAEILKDMNDDVDFFVAGIGTGGTISGNGKLLKEKIEKIKIIGVEPDTSAVITTGVKGPHKIQGIGAGFIPDNYWSKYVDEVMTSNIEDSRKYSRMVAEKEGILVGYSAGAALSVAVKLASKEDNRDKKIVVIFPDNGERYLSCDLYE
jgi:cysteine synthase A